MHRRSLQRGAPCMHACMCSLLPKLPRAASGHYTITSASSRGGLVSSFSTWRALPCAPLCGAPLKWATTVMQSCVVVHQHVHVAVFKTMMLLRMRRKKADLVRRQQRTHVALEGWAVDLGGCNPRGGLVLQVGRLAPQDGDGTPHLHQGRRTCSSDPVPSSGAFRRHRV